MIKVVYLSYLLYFDLKYYDTVDRSVVWIFLVRDSLLLINNIFSVRYFLVTHLKMVKKAYYLSFENRGQQMLTRENTMLRLLDKFACFDPPIIYWFYSRASLKMHSES